MEQWELIAAAVMGTGVFAFMTTYAWAMKEEPNYEEVV
jgi:hypothetical protein